MVERGRCGPHQHQHDQAILRARGTAARRGYDRAWQELRDAYARTHPFCEDHLAKGEHVVMDIVDHRLALRDGGGRLDPQNLRALCRSCHGFKTAAEGRARVSRFGPVDFFQAPPAEDRARAERMRLQNPNWLVVR